MSIENNDPQLPGSAKELGGPVSFDDPSLRLVRPYTVTGGRTQSRFHLALEALVKPRSSSRAFSPSSLRNARPLSSSAGTGDPWQNPAVLRIPLEPTRILVADLVADGHMHIISEGQETPLDHDLLERVRAGIRNKSGADAERGHEARAVLMHAEYQVADAVTVDEDAGLADVMSRARRPPTTH